MIDISLIEAFASLGIGALFALVILYMYRIDRKASEKRLLKLLEQDQEIRREYTQALIAHTEVLTELVTLVKRLNGRLQ